MSRRDRAWMRPFLMKESSIMITAENAVLRVKRIRHSRNGAFSVADLTTEFGEFKVKDPMLDQFDIVHFHIDHFQLPVMRERDTPYVTTFHGRPSVSKIGL